MATGGYFDRFVDSVNGDDNNNGHTPDTPLATIGALPTMPSGSTVYLARGSHWREQLTIGANNIAVEAYGTGDAPLLDASDVLTNASFVATDGRTNVYQINKNVGAASVDNQVHIWEDDARLTRVASTALCDSTPGSFYASAENGDVVVYVHPIGSTDPTSDGKTYEVSVRDGGVIADNRTGITIRGIRTRRNRRGSGSIVTGRSCNIYDCIVEDGNKHNIFYQDGCYLEGVISNNCFGGTSFILYDDGPTGLGVRLVECEVIQDAYTNGTGFYNHAAGGGSFGLVRYERCRVEKYAYGFSGLNADACEAIDCELVDCGAGHYIEESLYTVRGGTITMSAVAGGSERGVQVGASAGVVLVEDVTFVAESGLSIFSTQLGKTITVEDCVFDLSFAAAIHVLFASTLNIHNCEFSDSSYIYSIGADTDIDSDFNTFGTGAFLIDFETKTWAQYRALTGQDANSTHP